MRYQFQETARMTCLLVIENADFPVFPGVQNGISLTGCTDMLLRRIAVAASNAGIYAPSGANIDLVNCTITGGAVGVRPALDPDSEIRNCIIWGNTDDIYGSVAGPVTYSDIGESLWAGTNGNINEDPLFDSDLHLLPGSPCIDTGDPNDPVSPGGGARIDSGFPISTWAPRRWLNGQRFAAVLRRPGCRNLHSYPSNPRWAGIAPRIGGLWTSFSLTR